MGKFNRVCADTIQRKLQLEDHSHKEMLKIYKKRWTIEKMFRTARQYFGLQDCQAIKMQTHKNHIASVFLAYSHVIIEQKRKGLKSAEEAIRALKL
jgi:transposase